MPRLAHASLFIIFCAILFPFVTFAADATSVALPVGFATAPLWVSSASPVDGDALKIFAVVNNSSSFTVNGSVSFLVDGVVVGSAVKVSLANGAAQLVSADWKSTVGEHLLTATLESSEQAGQVLGTAGPISITVTPAPPAPAVVQYLTAAVDLSGGALNTAIQTLEDIRHKGADYFASQSSATSPSATPVGTVLGTTTESVASGTTPAASTAAGASLFNRLGSLIFENPMFFYPLILLVCFFVLWIILKLFSRD